MITLEKIKNEKKLNSCNNCLNNNAKTLYKLLVAYDNAGGQQITFCKECLKELKQKIKLR